MKHYKIRILLEITKSSLWSNYVPKSDQKLIMNNSGEKITLANWKVPTNRRTWITKIIVHRAKFIQNTIVLKVWNWKDFASFFGFATLAHFSICTLFYLLAGGFLTLGKRWWLRGGFPHRWDRITFLWFKISAPSDMYLGKGELDSPIGKRGQK